MESAAAAANVSGPPFGLLIALIVLAGVLVLIALRLRPQWFARDERPTTD